MSTQTAKHVDRERAHRAYEDSCAVDVRLWRKADIAERAAFYNPSQKALELAKRAILNAQGHYENVTNPLRAEWLAVCKRGA
jgi:hypothetical protein